MIIIHDALDLIVQSPVRAQAQPPSRYLSPQPPPPSDMGQGGPPMALPPASSIWWPLLETCSLDLTIQPLAPNGTDLWWPLKHIQTVGK